MSTQTFTRPLILRDLGGLQPILLLFQISHENYSRIAQFQQVDAHKPSMTNAFTTKLALANGATRPFRLPLMSATVATIVLTGVMKKTQRKKLSEV